MGSGCARRADWLAGPARLAGQLQDSYRWSAAAAAPRYVIARRRRGANSPRFGTLGYVPHGWRIVETLGGAFRLVIVRFKAERRIIVVLFN